MNKEYWEKYFIAIKNQDWEQAKNTLEYIASIEKNNPHVKLKLGDIYQRLGEPLKAIHAYHESAWLLVKRGFIQKALALYKIILRLDSFNSEAIQKSKELIMEIESLKRQKTAVSSFETDSNKYQVEEAEKADVIQSTTVEEIQKHSIFSSLSEIDIKNLINRGITHSFTPGKIILKEGGPGDSIFYIKSGRVKVLTNILNKEIELAILLPNDIFGEVAFLTGRPRTASVIALDQIEVIEFSKSLLEEICEKYPNLLEKLHDFYHCRLDNTIRKVKSEIKKGHKGHN